MDLVRALVRTYLFQDLSPAEVDGLADAGRVRRLKRGEHAFRAGDFADELWVVVSGQIKEYVLSRDGDEYVSDLHGPGAVFGEPALFVPERIRVVNEIAMDETVVITVERTRLFTFLLQHPPAMLRLLEGLSVDSRAVSEDVLALAYAQVKARVLTKLVQLSETHGVEAATGLRIDLQISQSVLAGMVGATRENVNRALVPLIAAGYLRLEQGEIIVADLTELRRLADLDGPLLQRRNRRSVEP
jgi:CRP/FNR family cyclic AMP-dependent transcriptional regulator